MKITLPQFQHFLRDPGYLGLPTHIAEQKNQNIVWWGNTLSRLLEEGAKLLIWEKLTEIAILFDAYPGVIESVELTFDLENPGPYMYMTCDTRINGKGQRSGTDLRTAQTGSSTSSLLDEYTLARCHEIDGGVVFETFAHEIGNAGNTHLISHLSTIQLAFKRVFLSAEEARRVAQEQAPEIDQFVKGWLLDQIVQQSPIHTRPDRPAPKF